MAYNPNIPLGTDFMAVSNGQIRRNYQTINTVFSKNHVTLTAKDNEGMHNQMTFRIQSGDPTTTVDQVALYTKLVSSVAHIFFRPSNNQTPIQLTYPSISTGLQSTVPDVYIAQQYSFMAGPFVIYMGTINPVTDNQLIVLLPATTLVYVGILRSNDGAGTNAAATNIVANQFNVRFGVSSFPGPFQVKYVAIGV